MKSLKNDNLPQVDFPVDYLAWTNISGKVLNAYGNYPCKIQAGIFALCLRGQVKAVINMTEYAISAHDLIFLVPDSFIEVLETTKDTRIAFVGFSSAFINTVEFWKMVTGYFFSMLSNPVAHLSEKVFSVYKDVFNTISRGLNMPGMVVTRSMMVSTLNYLLEGVSSLHEVMTPSGAETRDCIIFRDFVKLAFEQYRTQHKVSFYAKAAKLTLSHFCAAVNKASGRTASEIITKLIIMDAKGQLRGSTLPINKIAESLGFDNPTTFTRYFREYVGMTPQEYRNLR